MTSSEAPVAGRSSDRSPAPPSPLAGDGRGSALLLVGLGVVGEQGAAGLPPLERVAIRLAERLAVPRLGLDATIPADAALAALAQAAAGQSAGCLAALPGDVGMATAQGPAWAEVLGAWRQPCLLVCGAAQLRCGWPAAGTALLQRWRVPLVGLLQWGGDWNEFDRRRDGLPWLGLLADQGEDQGDGSGATAGQALNQRAMQALPISLRQRWRLLASA